MATTLIIGGTKGIGAALTELLAPNNNVTVIARNRPETPVTGVTYHELDVLTDELPELDEVQSLVYCPGTINLKPLRSLKEADFRTDFEVNVMGAVRAVKHYFTALKQAENPSILLYSTVAVGTGMPFHSSVAAAKGAVEGLTRSLAAEFAPTIRVNCIAPTITDTPLAAGILRNDAAREKLAGNQPLKRIGTPADIAALSAFLIGDGAQLMTGQVIAADAGLGTVKP